MKDKISHKSSLAKIFIIALTLSTTLSSCTPEKRTMLRLTAETFRNQAVEAIASVKKSTN